MAEPTRSESKRQNAAAARENVRLGWCSCGDEVGHDCECFGVYQLSVQQGLTAPEVARTEPPEVAR